MPPVDLRVDKPETSDYRVAFVGRNVEGFVNGVGEECVILHASGEGGAAKQFGTEIQTPAFSLESRAVSRINRPEYIRGEEETVDDDAMTVIDKMKDADVIVLASPVYFYSMTGQMKSLIDRTYNHEKDLGEKEFYYIITSTDRDPEALDGTIEGFRGFIRCLYQSVERGIVRGNGARERGAIESHPAMQEAYNLGKEV